VLEKDSEGRFIARKTAKNLKAHESIHREIKILKTMDHPLVVRIHVGCFGGNSANLAVVTDFVANGSLANHLPNVNNCEIYQLRRSSRITRIIAGIVLAVRYIHSRGIIHRNLTPDNILLDFDLNVQICDFGHIVSPDQPKRRVAHDPGGTASLTDVMSSYTAPEAYDNMIVPENDVFSFRMILYELIVGRLMFPQSMGPLKRMKALVHGNLRLDIPEAVFPATEQLIRDCLALDYRE
jgi:serine/threonine protein kinase